MFINVTGKFFTLENFRNTCTIAVILHLEIGLFQLSFCQFLFKEYSVRQLFFDHSIDFRLYEAFFLLAISRQSFRTIIESWLIQGQFEVVQFLLGSLYCDIDNGIASRFFQIWIDIHPLIFKKIIIFPMNLSWYFFFEDSYSVAKLPLVFASRWATILDESKFTCDVKIGRKGWCQRPLASHSCTIFDDSWGRKAPFDDFFPSLNLHQSWDLLQICHFCYFSSVFKIDNTVFLPLKIHSIEVFFVHQIQDGRHGVVVHRVRVEVWVRGAAVSIWS